RDDQAEADDDLGRRDRHHGEREDLAVGVPERAREADQREVRPVQHDLEREQDDQRAAAEQDAERADPEQDRRHGEVPRDIRSLHSGASSGSPGWSWREWPPRITPPTAATSRTIEVISNAS